MVVCSAYSPPCLLLTSYHFCCYYFFWWYRWLGAPTKDMAMFVNRQQILVSEQTAYLANCLPFTHKGTSVITGKRDNPTCLTFMVDWFSVWAYDVLCSDMMWCYMLRYLCSYCWSSDLAFPASALCLSLSIFFFNFFFPPARHLGSDHRAESRQQKYWLM